MPQSYVEKVGDAYRITGSRVSLDSVVYAYWNGQSAEGIAQSLSALTLEQIHGALAFYLAHRSEIDGYLQRAQSEFDAQREASHSRRL